MRASRTPIVLLAALIFAGGCKEREKSQAAARPENLILISIDTLRADHMSVYGYPRATTPRIDDYARRGAVFMNAISASSWTVPAHLSLFTGLDPHAHGCVNYPESGRLNPKHQTLARIFLERGFRTAAFTGGGMMSDVRGADLGFEVYEYAGQIRQTAFDASLPSALEWLDRLGGKPFFLFLHGYDVHRPYTPPPEHRERFMEGYQGNYDILDFLPNRPRPSDADLRYVISQYDAEIAAADAILGGFLDELKSRGWLDRTVVAIVSDHGDEFFEHDRCDHIHTLYDELLRVPWVLFGPTVPPVVVESQVAMIDLLPTLLDIFQIPGDWNFQGRSRRPQILNPGLAPVEEYAYSATGFSEYPYYLTSVRTSTWKLVANDLAGMQAVDWATVEKRPVYTYKFKDRSDFFYELFDLRTDGAERSNAADQHPEIVADLRARLEQRALENRQRLKETGSPMEQKPERGGRHREVMRSLGYVDDDDEEG